MNSRFILCLALTLLNAPTSSADDVFGRKKDGLGASQVLLGIGEFFGGFFASVAGASSLDTSSGKSKWHLENVKLAENALENLRDAIRRDERLQQILELERALHAAKMAGCGSAVEEMGNSLAALVRTAPGPGQRRSEEWTTLESEFENEVRQREMARGHYQARSKVVLAVGTLLFVDIGVRIYVFQEEDRSPGAFPTANLAWSYAVRPGLRLLGIYDVLEAAYSDEPQSQGPGLSP